LCGFTAVRGFGCTVGHIVQDIVKHNSEAKFTVTFKDKSSLVSISHYNMEADIAVFKLPQELGMTSLKVVKQRAAIQARCWLFKYDNRLQKDLDKSQGHVQSYEGMVLYHMCNSVSGNCGFALVNEFGHLLGIHKSGTTGGPNGAIPADIVVQLCDASIPRRVHSSATVAAPSTTDEKHDKKDFPIAPSQESSTSSETDDSSTDSM